MIKSPKDQKEKLLKEIALSELNNAEKSIQIYQKAPWLNLNRRIEGKFFPGIEMVIEKIQILQLFLQGKK